MAATQIFGDVHILLVDDDRKVRPIYEHHLRDCRLLMAEGFSTRLHWAESAADAIEIAQAIAADEEDLACALVDYYLGGTRDGIDVMNEVWKLHAGAQCTLVTAARELRQSDIEPRIPAPFEGHWDFVAKPFTGLEVAQRVRRALVTWLAQRNARRHEVQNAHLIKLLATTNLELESKVKRRTAMLSQKNQQLEENYAKLQAAVHELGVAQAMLVQQEKMACIGQLAAGVAHELNNPIGFVHSNLGTLGRHCEKLSTVLEAYRARVGSDPELDELGRLQKIAFVLEDLPELIQESLEGTERVRRIVQDLRFFSHGGEDRRYVDLNDCVRSTLNIVWNELKYKAKLSTEFGELPAVQCAPGQINQVLMNLLVNAAQAIDDEGDIRVVTVSADGMVLIRITDNGCGIPAEARARIFDPFFTTKAPGEGTGLGLCISYDIVRRHGGTITVESEVGKGTTFTVSLPVSVPVDEQG